MQRVDTLIKKLQEQFAAKSPASQLLLTVQMLEVELYQLQLTAPATTGSINVDIPQTILPPAPREEERTVEILQVDETEIEKELEEIKRHAEEMQKMAVHVKPQVVFEQEEEQDIPTLAHQLHDTVAPKKEINETAGAQAGSLNDKLKQSKIDLGDSLIDLPIRDLRKAIGINDRFLYINELFRGDESMYERSIKTINSFSILPEAEYWIQRELKTKIGWSDSNETVKQFIQLVKRRFT
jgi:hypothetical protein